MDITRYMKDVHLHLDEFLLGSSLGESGLRQHV